MSASGFACNQTPLQFPDGFSIASISRQSNDYGNAGARLWALAPGSGRVSAPPDNSVGIVVEENIQNSFTLRSLGYTLIDMRIMKGRHKIFKWDDVQSQLGSVVAKSGTFTTAPLEVYIFFKNSANQTIALVLPIGIDNSRTTNASAYINSLRQPADTPPLPLSALFQDLAGARTSASFNANNPMLEYTGADIRMYSNASTCDASSIPYPVKYLVIMNDVGGTNKFSTTIKYKEYTNVSTLSKVIEGTIQPITTATTDTNKLRIIPSGTLYITNSITQTSNNVATNALQCYPVDPAKNIKDGTLYLDEKGTPTTLADELKSPSSSQIGVPINSSWWSSPAGIETMIAIGVAVLIIGAIMGAFIHYWKPDVLPAIKAAPSKAGSFFAWLGVSSLTGISSAATATGTAVAPYFNIITAIAAVLFFITTIIFAILYAGK